MLQTKTIFEVEVGLRRAKIGYDLVTLRVSIFLYHIFADYSIANQMQPTSSSSMEVMAA